MKRKKYLNRSIFSLLYISVLFLSSCIAEKGWEDEMVANEEEVMVSFDVKLPSSIQQVTRSTQTTEEAEVKNIYALIFENDGTYVGRKVITQNNMTVDPDDPELLTFKISLLLSKSTDPADRYEVILLANMSDAGTESLVSQINAQVAAKADRDVFLQGLTYSSVTNPEAPFPMASLVKGPQTISSTTDFTGSNRFEMIRMVARMDMGFDASYAGYTIEEVHFYNYNRYGLVWHNQEDIPSTVVLPPSPGKEEDKSYSVVNTNTGKTSFSAQMYTLEATVEESDETRPCLVVRITDGTEDLGWYRIDFARSDGTYLDIVRNYRYIFTITGVKGNGFDDADTAYRSKSSNLEAEIIDWSDTGVDEVVTDGQYILGVAPVKIELDAEVSTGNTITVKTTSPVWSYHLSDNAESKDVQVAKPDWITFNGSYTEGTEITGGSTNPGYTLTFSVTENTTTDRTAYVHITTGKMTILVTIVQKAPLGLTLNVSGPSSEYSYAGGSQNYRVESYGTSSGGSTTPIAWIAEFSTDGGSTWSSAAPAWLTTFTTNGTGGTGTNYTATVAAFPGVTLPNQEDELLKSATPKGSPSSPYDLSTKGGTTSMNTANCYIVNGPGYYKLPLVYGNAIKNGADNENAYISNLGGTYSLSRFLRHDDLPITGPYIYDQASPVGAKFVWMDQPNLVVNLDLTDGGQSLYFQVLQEHIVQGNAIVAVHSADGTILWSWHIWFTPLVDSQNPATIAVTSYQGYTYDFMQYNIGWYTERTTQYGEVPRSVEVRISQTGITTPQSTTFTITQNSHQETLPATGLLWQWGRKDPMPTTTETNISSGEDFTTIVGPVSIGQAIQNPYVRYRGSVDGSIDIDSWCANSYRNLWNSNSSSTSVNDDEVIKTVYDPSPVGFKMPSSGAFTGFTTTGESTSDVSEFNTVGAWNSGWNFKANGNATIYFPITYLRPEISASLRWNNDGHYYSAGVSNYTGRGLHLTESRIDNTTSYRKANTLAVRSVKE